MDGSRPARPGRSTIVAMTVPAEHWPFLRAEGIAAGLTRHQVDGPAYQRLLGTVRIRAGVALTPALMARAALLLVPHGVVSHHTAARLWGGIVPHDPDVHVTVGHAAARRRRPGLRCAVRRDLQVSRHAGLVLTSPEQTFIDLGTRLTLVDLTVLGDSLVHRGVTTPDRLLDAAAGARVVEARRAAALVRPGTESAMETRSRLLLVLGGLPEPRVNAWVVDETGRRRYRLDLPYPELLLAFEYDGRHHAEDPRQWGHDLARREWLEGRGWRLVVLRAEDVFTTPWATVLRAREALAARGFDVALPRDPPPEFARHFPGRPWRTRAA